MNRVLLAFALVTLIGYLGPLAFPSAVDAQQPAAPRRIGVLLGGLSSESKEAIPESVLLQADDVIR